MIDHCPYCGDWHANKTLSSDVLTCPACGRSWPIRRLPLMILTGCSGVGKTTTALRLRQRGVDFPVLDIDMFYHGESTDMPELIDTMMHLSADLMQSGRPVLWAMAGGIDLLAKARLYPCFSSVRCLALVCEKSELRRRMVEGRGITAEGWLNGSAEYNDYFLTHSELGGIALDRLDITHLTPDDAAARVETWVQAQA